MVFLYDRFADCFPFSPVGWAEVLTNASAYGWKALGTLPPPARSDLDIWYSETVTWDGNYTRPEGQTVSPNDAIALAAAIDQALKLGARWKANSPSVLRAFAAFCQQRGFLISSTLFINPSALVPGPITALSRPFKRAS